MVGSAKRFIRAFFDQNPLSQIGILLLKNGSCEILSPLSGSPVHPSPLLPHSPALQEAHVRKLEGPIDLGGNLSIQNGLEIVLDILKSVPGHGHREAILLLSPGSSCDPGNIFSTLQQLEEERVRVDVVGTEVSVHIRQIMAEMTKGRYFIPMSESHLTEFLNELVPAPAALLNAAKPTLVPLSLRGALCLSVMQVRMGFPEKNPDGPRGVAFEGSEAWLTDGGYTCNRCKARVPELPCQCHICGLTLVSAPQLARSYHHLFPVQPFEELEAEADRPQKCHGCLKALKSGESVISRCLKCDAIYCFECDIYIHETLHNCPKCETL